MGFPQPTLLDLGDVDIAVYQQGEISAPPVLLVHGWPEMAYSWKHQLPALAQAGYRAIALDLRGFGHSSAPKARSAYHIQNIVGDIEGVLGKLGIREVVLVGHDWGGIIVWSAAKMLANRVRGVVSICTPLVKPSPVDPIEIFKKRYGEDHYFVAFQEEGVAEAVFEDNPMALFNMIFRSVPKDAKPTKEMFYLVKNFKAYLANHAPDLPGGVMSDEDMQVFAGAYLSSGFHGGINLYRNVTANWEFAKTLPEHIDQPCLMVNPENDLFLPPSASDHMVDLIADLERQIIKDCGHWAMWEKPEDINKVLIEWLHRKMGLRFY